jgi:hypothetical protein
MEKGRPKAGEPVENLPRDTDKTRDAVAAEIGTALSGGKDGITIQRDIHESSATTEALWKHSPAIFQAGTTSTRLCIGDNPPRHHRLSSRQPNGSPGAWPTYSPRLDLR